MPQSLVVIVGAGATKACGGPLTNEILPGIFDNIQSIEREGFLNLLNRFLINVFHVPVEIHQRRKHHYPPLPLLLSLIDLAIEKKEPLSSEWSLEELVHLRDAIEYGIFALLEKELRRTTKNPYFDLFIQISSYSNIQPQVISLNYDIYPDNTLLRISEYSRSGFPDYGCEIVTDFYRKMPRYGALYKLHGSLNWLYCPGCHRLELGVSESGRQTVKVLNELYMQNPLEPRYGCHGSRCPECGTFVRPVIITPTHSKDYRNPHISQIWYKSERLLRSADRVLIIGYSLPEDDLNVIYLLKKGLNHLNPNMITVVEYDPENRSINDHPVGLRYRSLFGEAIDWRTEGFEDWVRELSRRGVSPIDGRL